MGTPIVFADRVIVTTTTVSTGAYSLGAAVTGYLTPAQAGVASGSRVSYVVVDSLTAPTAMEVGEGIYSTGTPDQLTRALVRRNTTGGTSAVNWATGTKFIMLAPCAANVPSLETDGQLTLAALALTGGLTIGNGFTLSAGVAVVPAGTAAAPSVRVGGQQNGLSAPSANTLVVSAGGSGIGTFNASGLSVTGNVSWTSDRRMKDRIRPARVGLVQALAITPVTFNWKGGGRKRRLGVIAQEVQAAHGAAVSQAPTSGLLSVDAAAMDAILLGAVRDLAGMVEELRVQNKALAARVKKLERNGRA